jgi:hypothetical protein
MRTQIKKTGHHGDIGLVRKIKNFTIQYEVNNISYECKVSGYNFGVVQLRIDHLNKLYKNIKINEILLEDS